MTSVDNNYPVDDEVCQMVEEELEKLLRHCEREEWVKLEHIYRYLDVNYTRERNGSLDRLIEDTLDRWNWPCEHIGRGQLSYVRSYRRPKSATLTLADGLVVPLIGSWPPPTSPGGLKEIM